MRRKRQHEDEEFYFAGFSSPNTTPVPDELFDVLAARLTESELRVLLYIVRRTFGFKKRSDAISLKQMVEGIKTRDGRVMDVGTGMSKQGVLRGVQGLVRKGIIEVHRRLTDEGDSEVNVYSLRFRDEGGGEREDTGNGNTPRGPYPRVVNEVDHRGQSDIPTRGQSRRPTTNRDTRNRSTSTTSRRSSPDARHQPSDVVADHIEDMGEDQALAQSLIEHLKDLGVHPKTAERLAREEDLDYLAGMIGFLQWRLEHGWQPEVSAAAWIVAAVKEHYELPEAFTHQGADTREHRRRAEEARQRQERELDEQRERRLTQLGVDRETSDLWEGAVARLREAGEWSPVLAAVVLRRTSKGCYEVLVPWAELVARVERRREQIRRAISDQVGEDVEVEVRPGGRT